MLLQLWAQGRSLFGELSAHKLQRGQKKEELLTCLSGPSLDFNVKLKFKVSLDTLLASFEKFSMIF